MIHRCRLMTMKALHLKDKKMRFFKILFPALILSFFGSFVVCQGATDNNDIEVAKKFIEDTGNKVIQILVDKSTPLSQRQDQFRQVIQEKFDMRSIGQFVLGRYWKQATKDQKDEFLKLFEDSVVESYSHQFDNYTNEKLNVTNGRPSSKGGVIVTSKITRSSGAPLQVDWKIFKVNGKLRILDVIVSGVSMSITYRSDYANAYNSHGGSIQGLLTALRAKEVTSAVPGKQDQ